MPVEVLRPGVVGGIGPETGEGEVEAGPLEVSVRLMRRGSEDPWRIRKCRQRPVVDASEGPPGGGDLDCVDDDPGPGDRLERRRVVALSEPSLDEADVEGLGGLTLLRENLHRRVDNQGVAFVESDEDVAVWKVESPFR